MGILKTCCLWGSIRTGCYICVVYTIVLSLITIGLSGFELTFKAMEKTFELSASIINLILGILMFFASLLLCYGVYKDNRWLFIPWLVIMILYTAHEIMNFIYYIYQLIMSEETNAMTTNPGVFWFTALTWPFELYCILCITSQFQELMAGRGSVYYIKSTSGMHDTYKVMPRESVESTKSFPSSPHENEPPASHEANLTTENIRYQNRLETIEEDTPSILELSPS